MVDKIKALCKEKGISIYKLEKELGIGNGTIGRWDKSAPNYSRLKAVANYFGVPVSELTEEAKKESPPNGGELSEKDVRLIEWFRSLPPEKQKAILISQDAPKELID